MISAPDRERWIETQCNYGDTFVREMTPRLENRHNLTLDIAAKASWIPTLANADVSKRSAPMLSAYSVAI